MENISDSDKQRIINFINENELDYTIKDNGITRFSIISEDNKIFFVYPYNGEYVLVLYDVEKDVEGGSFNSNLYQYFNFKTLQQILEQLKVYDQSLYKQYYYPTMDSIDIGFNSSDHIDNWYEEFTDGDCYQIIDDEQYKYIQYEDKNKSPMIKSPWNNIGDVTMYHNSEPVQVDTLYFEIHPIQTTKGGEKYLLKLKCNNEQVLKEYINYIVSRKKGLKMLLDEIFKF